MATRTFLEWNSGKDANAVKIKHEQELHSNTSGCSQQIYCGYCCGQLDSTLDIINLTICALTHTFLKESFIKVNLLVFPLCLEMRLQFSPTDLPIQKIN